MIGVNMIDNRTTKLVSYREVKTLLTGFLCEYQNILLSRGINAGEAVCKQNELIDEYAERIEQVISAMLRNSTLTAEQVHKVVGRHGNIMNNRLYEDWQAVADELNAELSVKECEWTLKEKWPNYSGNDHVYGYETSCGARHTWWPDSLPNFCPTCGGRVKAVK